MSINHLSDTGIAGNTNKDFVTPAITHRRLLYGLAKLTTDATVADRWMRLGVLDESGTTIVCLCAGKEVAASASDQWFSYLQGVYRETLFINNVIQVPIAHNLIIPPGYTLRVFAENGVAGDSFDCDLLVEDTHIGARA